MHPRDPKAWKALCLSFPSRDFHSRYQTGSNKDATETSRRSHPTSPSFYLMAQGFLPSLRPRAIPPQLPASRTCLSWAPGPDSFFGGHAPASQRRAGRVGVCLCKPVSKF